MTLKAFSTPKEASLVRNLPLHGESFREDNYQAFLVAREFRSEGYDFVDGKYVKSSTVTLHKPSPRASLIRRIGRKIFAQIQ